MDISKIHKPRRRVFGSVAKVFPHQLRQQGLRLYQCRAYVSQIMYYRTSHPEQQQIIPNVQRLLISKPIKCDLYKIPNCLLNEPKLSDMRICCVI